jgi:AraC-like DNA-binding protein
MDVPAGPVDRTLFHGRLVRIGAFRCPARHPSFRDSGPIESYIVVFPRTCVWIRHRNHEAFVADPGIATIYNAGQPYTREEIDPRGDLCDWFGVDLGTAREIAADLEPAAHHSISPFRFPSAPITSDIYLRQRMLFERVATGQPDGQLAIEEQALGIVAAVQRGAYRARGIDAVRDEPTGPRHRDLAARARAELARDLGEPLSLEALARRVEASPYHLSRVFHVVCGTTLHRHRQDLRLRAALERLRDGGADLSRIALDVGFSSHSHFSAAFRQAFGTTPSRARAALARGGRAVS